MKRVVILILLWVGIMVGFLFSHTPEGRGLFAFLIGFFSIALVRNVTTLNRA